MKNLLLVGSIVVAGIAGTARPVQDGHSGDDKQKSRQEVVEEDVAALRLDLEKLQASFVELQSQHDQLVSWAQEQSRAAAAMEATLAASESAGFTAGINPRSRELLLQGWRANLSSLQKGVPATKKGAAGAGKDAKRPR